MHKKRIGDKDYFYTSVRDSSGKVKTIYLGSNRKSAIRKEKELGLSSKKINFNLHLFFIVLLISMGVAGLFSFIGFTVLNISDESHVGESSNDSYLGEGEVSISSLEDSQTTSLDNGTSSSLLQENDGDISVNINESIEGNVYVENILINETDFVNESIGTNFSLNISEVLNESNISINLSETNLTNASQEVILINETLNETINASVETIQYGAIINKPVKWKKVIVLDSPSDNLTVELPNQATNISIVKIESGYEVNVDLSKVKVKEKNEVVSLEKTNLITGEVVSDVNIFVNVFSFIGNLFSKLFSLTGYDVVEIEEKVGEEIEIIIEEEVEEVEIEYETPGPNSTEINLTDYKKQIVVSSDIHYENILAFTEIPNAQLNAIKLYWLVNETKESANFIGYDTDEDNLVDYIEWVVPHLSNQTYELEITILNVQSYPSLNGNWTVLFNTSGVANLTIRGYNDTPWSNSSEDPNLYDLKFLDLSCGNNSVNYSWIGDSVFIQDYNCIYTGEEISKVLTAEKHTLEFDYGGIKAYAYNDVNQSLCNDSITTPNETYLLNASISDYNSSTYCFNINADNVTFDCQGNTIDGSDSTVYNITAINVNSSTNVTVKNCIITDFSYGIYYEDSNLGNVTNNTVKSSVPINNSFKGITSDNSNNTIIDNNNVQNIGSSDDSQSGAIGLSGTRANNVTNNVIKLIEGDGVFVGSGSKGSRITNNFINDTLSTSIIGSTCCAAIRVDSSSDSLIDSNTIDGNPSTSNSNIGVRLDNSSRINITKNIIINSTNKNIYLVSSNYNNISNNTLNHTKNLDGLHLFSSNDNTILNNKIHNSGYEGINLDVDSENNNVTLNDIFASAVNGIGIYDSDNNTIYTATISNSNWSGLFFRNSSNTLIADSTLSNNNLDGGKGDVSMDGNTSGVQTLLNVSFNQSDMNITESGTIYVQWYLDVNVRDVSGNLQNANVSAWQISGSLEFSELTDSNGDIVQQNATEFFENSSVRIYYNNYTLNTTKSGYITDSRQLNITTNTQENVVLSSQCGITITEDYTFDSDLNCTADGIIIGANDIVLDCVGYTLSGTDNSSYYGVKNSRYSNVTVKNCIVNDFGKGIYFTGSSSDNGTVQNNTLFSNEIGIYMQFGDEHVVINNNASLNTDKGISIDSSNDNFIEHNYCYGNTNDGIRNSRAYANTYTNNTCRNNGYGFYVNHGASVNNIFVNNHLTSNTNGAIFHEGSGTGNVVIYNNSNGEIKWFKDDNLTMGPDLDFGSNLDITLNNIYFNTSAGSNYNRSANLTFNSIDSLNINTTIPFRDGSICSDDICTELQDADTYIFNVTGFTNYSVGEFCGAILTSSKTLKKNLNCSGYGLSLGADDIVLDCANYNINYSFNELGMGINNPNGFDNVTVQNCNVFESVATATKQYGIYFKNSENSTIKDNNITTLSGNSAGIYLFTGNTNLNVTSNVLKTSGIGSSGLRIQDTSDSTFDSNSINVTFSADAIHLIGDADDNLVQNNNVLEATSDAIVLDSISGKYPENNNFTNNTLSNINSYDLNIVDASINGTYLLDQTITDYSIVGIGSVIYFKDTGEGEIKYLEPINGSGTDLNKEVQISSNLIKVDSSSNSGLNKSANLTFYNIDSLVGSGDRKPLRNGEDCDSSICTEITDADSYLFNVTGFTNYSVGLVNVTAAISSGGSVITTYPEGKCGIDADCEEGYLCIEENCILPECTVDKDCSLDKKCIGNTCIKLFDLRILDVVDSSVTVGKEIEFTYYILAMSEIDNDVIITYWLDDGKDIAFGPSLSNNCGDGYIMGDEECDLGEKNTNMECVSEYGSSCNYCNLNCKLNNVRGSYCGDNVCDNEEDFFVCSEDCGEPNLGSKIINTLKNIFRFTGFTVVGGVNQEVIYVGNIGDELTLSSSLYVPTEVKPGIYELHIKLNYAGSEVEAIKTIEILEEPELAPVEEKIEYSKYAYTIFLIISIIILVYLIFRAYKEIKKLSRKISRLKRPKPKKRVTRKLTEREKLIKKIKKWKSKGYDTSVLEVKLGEIVPTKVSKEEIKKKEFERRIREWESKGYDATILKNRLGISSKVVGIAKSEEKLLRNINKFEKKIKDWKKKGYDTKILEERLKKLKRKY